MTWFVCLGIGPSYESAAPFAGDVADGVQACDEDAVFGWREGYVYALVEEVRSTCSYSIRGFIEGFMMETRDGWRRRDEKLERSQEMIRRNEVMGLNHNYTEPPSTSSISLTLPSMETLGNNVIMTRQVSPTLTTRVDLRSVQIHHGVVLDLRFFR